MIKPCSLQDEQRQKKEELQSVGFFKILKILWAIYKSIREICKSISGIDGRSPNDPVFSEERTPKKWPSSKKPLLIL